MKRSRFTEEQIIGVLKEHQAGSMMDVSTLRKLSSERRRFGYRRLHILLEREGWEVNWKRSAASSGTCG